jgi:hypothetical protein
MSRALFVSGFAVGRGNTERVMEALTGVNGPFSDADSRSYLSALENPRQFRRAAAGAVLVTHSAGALAIPSVIEAGSTTLPKPETIHAWAGPLPTSGATLLGRGMFRIPPGMVSQGFKGFGNMADLMRFNASYFPEFARRFIPHMRQLGAIAQFDSVAVGSAAVEAGVPTTLAYANDDRFYTITDEQREAASRAGVLVIDLLGQHNDPLVQAEEFAPGYFDAYSFISSRVTPD